MKRRCDFEYPTSVSNSLGIWTSRASSLSVTTPGSIFTEDDQKSPSASIGEPLVQDHQLPGYDGGCDRLVDTALTACTEILESRMQNIKS